MAASIHACKGVRKHYNWPPDMLKAAKKMSTASERRLGAAARWRSARCSGARLLVRFLLLTQALRGARRAARASGPREKAKAATVALSYRVGAARRRKLSRQGHCGHEVVHVVHVLREQEGRQERRGRVLPNEEGRAGDH